MKKIGLIILSSFILYSPLFAGEIYIWTDKNGIKHITDTPPPAKTKGKVERESYRQETPAEIEAWKQKQAEAADRLYGKDQAERRASKLNWQINEANARRRESLEENRQKAEKLQKEQINYELKQAESRAESARREKNSASDEYWRAFWQRHQNDAEFEARRLQDMQK